MHAAAERLKPARLCCFCHWVGLCCFCHRVGLVSNAVLLVPCRSVNDAKFLPYSITGMHMESDADVAAYLHFLQVWGPKVPTGPQYRRRRSESSNWGGGKQHDMSSVVGIWLPETGWQIYAQTLRPKPEKGTKPSYMVAEVWKLWPTTSNADKFRMWPTK